MEAAFATPSCAELLELGAERLRAAGIETARLDAEVLLALALETDRAGLYARCATAPSAAVAARFAASIARRMRREPLAYISGVREFWSLPFAVDPSVLIPRPETELLVEIVCRRVRRPRGATAADGAGISICDVGTGSGCLAVALAHELPAARLVAIDVSDAALAVAERNAAALGVADRIAFRSGDLFGPLAADDRFDLIVSNPPYLRPEDFLSPELGFEPRPALAAGDDGLEVIRRLLAAAPRRLRAWGWLVMELGRGQEAAARAVARAAGFASVDVEPDLAGIPRALVAGGAQ